MGAADGTRLVAQVRYMYSLSLDIDGALLLEEYPGGPAAGAAHRGLPPADGAQEAGQWVATVVCEGICATQLHEALEDFARKIPGLRIGSLMV